MKTCTRCGKEKTESEFQVRRLSNDGLTASCKSCLSAYDKTRAMLPHRVAMRKRYAKTENYKIAISKSSKKYRANNPNKYVATNMVNNAIRDKKLFKQPCEVCGKTKKIHGHHDDYAKPLNVRWLCDEHHKQWHSKNGEALNP
jgi:hypothetical protein